MLWMGHDDWLTDIRLNLQSLMIGGPVSNTYKNGWFTETLFDIKSTHYDIILNTIMKYYFIIMR